MLPIKDENPSTIQPFVTWALIAVNVAAYIWEVTSLVGQDAIIKAYGFIPARGVYFGIFTSMFLHGNLLHIASNMLYLYIFGDNVEDTCGHTSYITFYVVTGVAASLLFMFMEPNFVHPLVGASGAISGVLGGYALLFPRARILTAAISPFGFIRLIRVPAFFLIGFWFLLQLLYGLAGVQTGVAYWAHIGGLVAGVVLIKLFATRRRSW